MTSGTQHEAHAKYCRRLYCGSSNCHRTPSSSTLRTHAHLGGVQRDGRVGIAGLDRPSHHTSLERVLVYAPQGCEAAS